MENQPIVERFRDMPLSLLRYSSRLYLVKGDPKKEYTGRQSKNYYEKKVCTLKILSKSVSRMAMECLIGQKNEYTDFFHPVLGQAIGSLWEICAKSLKILI